MENLENFRKETRAWLEANCPADMRRPTQTEEDTCWGGRHWKFQSDAQRQWLQRLAAKSGGRPGRPGLEISIRRPAPVARAHGGERLDGTGVAARVRRWRTLARRGENSAPG